MNRFFAKPSKSEAAFSHLYSTCHKGLYSYALGQTGEMEAAADCLQETYVRLWKNIERAIEMSEEHQVRWLFTTVKNCIIDHQRRSTLRRSQSLSSVLEIPVDGGQERAAMANEALSEIASAIGRLPLELRTVLTMSVVGELTSEQIGLALGKPPGTVRYQLSSARAILAAAMKTKEVEALNGTIMKECPDDC